MVFDAKKTIPLIEEFNTAIPLQDVPAYLGATMRQVETLYRTGAIKPLAPRTGRGAVRNVVFDKAQLDDLLLCISSLPVFEDLSCDRHRRLSYVCQRGAGRFEDLFQEVLNGDVAGFRHPDKSGIASVYVDVSSVVSSRKAV